MAYPFTNYTSFAVFRQRLESEFACEFREEPMDVDGLPDTITYFARKVDGLEQVCVVFFPDPEKLVEPGIIRYVCRHLSVDPAVFGLHLG